jgi:hypothetical protein
MSEAPRIFPFVPVGLSQASAAERERVARAFVMEKQRKQQVCVDRLPPWICGQDPTLGYLSASGQRATETYMALRQSEDEMSKLLSSITNDLNSAVDFTSKQNMLKIGRPETFYNPERQKLGPFYDLEQKMESIRDQAKSLAEKAGMAKNHANNLRHQASEAFVATQTPTPPHHVSFIPPPPLPPPPATAAVISAALTGGRYQYVHPRRSSHLRSRMY